MTWECRVHIAAVKDQVNEPPDGEFFSFFFDQRTHEHAIVVAEWLIDSVGADWVGLRVKDSGHVFATVSYLTASDKLDWFIT